MFEKRIVTVFLLAFGAAYAQKVDIIMATLDPADSASYKLMDNMGAEWREISNGNVRLSIRAGGVVGDDLECVRRLRLGSIQAAGLTGAGLGDIDFGVAALQIPMMFDSYEELDYVRDRIAPKLEKRIEEKGFLVLTWGDAGWVRFFSNRPVNTLDDLRKLKLFTWAGDATEEDLWKANGFHVIPLPATDIVQQLETHGIDAVPTTALYAETTELYRMANYMCDLKWAPLIGATIISRATWEKIPAAQREPLLDSARRWGEVLKSYIRAQETRALEAMTKGRPGRESNRLTITTLTPAALAEWRKTTEGIYPQMKGKIVPTDLFDEVQRLRDEYRAKATAAVKGPAPAPAKKGGPALAQTAAAQNVSRALAFRHTESESDFRYIRVTVQQTAAIRDMSLDIAARTITLSAPADEAALAEWLFHELDRPLAPSRARAVHEYKKRLRLPGRSDEVVRVFFPAYMKGQALSDNVTAMRTISGLISISSYDPNCIVVARGTPKEMALVTWMIHEVDQPASKVKPGTAHEYRLPVPTPGHADERVKVFYLARAGTVQELGNMATAVRQTTGVLRLFPIFEQRAIIVRAPKEQMARVNQFLAERDGVGR